MNAVEYNSSRGYPADTWREVQQAVGAGVDGIPGPDTAAAVKQWQTHRGMLADGKVGPDTLTAITGKEVEPELLDPTRDTRAIAASEARLVIIDVSKWQKEPDWTLLARWSRVSGVMIKSTDGRGLADVDPQFARNWPGVKAQVLPRGAFHVAHPLSYGKRGCPTQAAQDHVTTVGDGGDLRSWVDLETKHVQEGVDLLGVDGMADWLHELVDELTRLQGRAPGLYLSHHGVSLLKDRAIEFVHLLTWWAAYYNHDLPLPVGGLAEKPFYLPAGWGWDVWQFTSQAYCVGIDGHVDCNVINPASALMKVLK